MLASWAVVTVYVTWCVPGSAAAVACVAATNAALATSVIPILVVARLTVVMSSTVPTSLPAQPRKNLIDNHFRADRLLLAPRQVLDFHFGAVVVDQRKRRTRPVRRAQRALEP